MSNKIVLALAAFGVIYLATRKKNAITVQSLESIGPGQYLTPEI